FRSSSSSAPLFQCRRTPAERARDFVRPESGKGGGSAELSSSSCGRAGRSRSVMGMEWAAAGAHREAGRRGGAWLDWRSFQEAEEERPWTGWAVDGRMPSTGRLLGAQRWVQRRAFRPGEVLGAGEERERKAAENKASKGFASSSSRSFSLALEFMMSLCASGSWRDEDEMIVLSSVKKRNDSAFPFPFHLSPIEQFGCE
ncbi:hypothetical protein BAE44_0018637, partial [Dichanthelium oligosanthes]